MVQLWKRSESAPQSLAAQARSGFCESLDQMPPAVSFPWSNTSCSMALAQRVPGAAFSGRAAKGGSRTAPFTPTVGPSLSLLICCSAMIVSQRLGKAQRASRRRASRQVTGDGSPERRRAVFFMAQQRDQACGGRRCAGQIVRSAYGRVGIYQRRRAIQPSKHLACLTWSTAGLPF
jgi:hypothetical protein